MTTCYIILSTTQIEPLPQLCALSHIEGSLCQENTYLLHKGCSLAMLLQGTGVTEKLLLSFLRHLLNQQCINGNNIQNSVKIPNCRFNA